MIYQQILKCCYNELMAKRKKRGRKSKKEKKGLPIKKETLKGILQIIIFVLSGLVLVSFSRQGAFLGWLNDLLVGYLGWSSIFVPFIFLSLGFLISNFKFPLGQPNVFIGILLFIISISALTRSGSFGEQAWDGIVVLITVPGAFIVLLGTSLVGLVVMFNTSLDNLLLWLARALSLLRTKLAGSKIAAGGAAFGKKREIKILGGDDSEDTEVKSQKQTEGKKQVKAQPRPSSSASTQSSSDEQLGNQLVSNMPGDEKIWSYPPLDIFSDDKGGKADRGDIKGNAGIIEETLDSFGIQAQIVEVNQGPAVTQYALQVSLGTKLSKITSLERDLALALAAPTGAIRIEAPIPGRRLVGIELPNRTPEFVPIRKMLASAEMSKNESKLAVAMGLDVAGKPIVANIAKMPHILIAGQTGSGKSVCLNTFLGSILFRSSPNEVKFILVDPKRVELTGYNGIPHLLSPVIVEPEKVVSALRWLLSEMDRRYKLFSEAGVRNIEGYNEMSGFQALPYIVFVVDELADVMLFSPVEVEDSITRLAQMSRATGIHMILATQRPSVDVITGLIKANIPARVAFAVSSQVDSRVIIDTQGAEKLLGKGDMLFLPPESAKPIRIQGAFISDKDTRELVTYLKNQGVVPQYTEEVVSMPKPGTVSVEGVDGETDELFKEAVELVCQADKASASLLQRRLSIGYARAARILDQLEAAGVVGPADGSKPREVLINSPQDILGS